MRASPWSLTSPPGVFTVIGPVVDLLSMSARNEPCSSDTSVALPLLGMFLMTTLEFGGMWNLTLSPAVTSTPP